MKHQKLPGAPLGGISWQDKSVGRVTVRAVVFDVGETLVDETRIWSEWADWLGIPRLTFLAVIGAGIKPGGDHREPFRIFRPDLDLAAERAKRSGRGPPRRGHDRRLLSRCRARIAVGPRGRVPRRRRRQSAEHASKRSSTRWTCRWTSSPRRTSWGVHKPDPAFFARIAEELRLAPAEVAYVGDRLDNDVGPAAAAGMVAIFIRRGPWAWVQAGRSNPPEAAATIEGLDELPSGPQGHGKPR